MTPMRLRLTGLGVVSAVLVTALVFFIDFAIVIGPTRPRLLLHDGEVVLGITVTQNDQLQAAAAVEFTSNPLDIAFLPAIRWRPPIYELAVPLWIPLALVGAWTWTGWRRSRRFTATQCQSCGYDLRGSAEPGTTACPECGQAR